MLMPEEKRPVSAGERASGTSDPSAEENDGVVPPGAAPSALPVSASVRVYERQLESLKNGIARLLRRPVVRIPEAVADSSFPCFVDAADDGPQLTDPYTGESCGNAIPMREAEVDDRYAATKPQRLGGPSPVVRLFADEHGIVGGTIDASDPEDKGDDLHRASMKRLYGKRNRIIAEWGSYPAISTQQNAKRGVDPE